MRDKLKSKQVIAAANISLAVTVVKPKSYSTPNSRIATLAITNTKPAPKKKSSNNLYSFILPLFTKTAFLEYNKTLNLSTEILKGSNLTAKKMAAIMRTMKNWYIKLGVGVFFLLSPSFLFASTLNVLTIKGLIINPVIQEYIEEGIRKTEQIQGYLLIRIDTPGGLLKPTENIVKMLLNARVPVICYVWPQGARAASAGSFIAYAGNILAMAPNTHIGAAHPVIGGGRWEEIGKTLQEKITNDTLALARNIAHARSRPYSFIKKTIKESLSFTAEEAKAQKAVDFIASNLKELLRDINNFHIVLGGDRTIVLHTKDIDINYITFSPRQKFLNAITDPNIAYLLFSLGFLALLFEITHPGFGLAGVSGIIALLLAFYAFQILPTNYAGLALVGVGIIFLIAEAFTPTFGLLTGAGLICFILGSVMLFPHSKIIHLPLKTIIPLAVLAFIWTNFILVKLIQIRKQRPLNGKEALVGKIGTAKTNILRHGKVNVEGETWNAKSSRLIKAGAEVVIKKVEGLRLIVEPLTVTKKEE